VSRTSLSDQLREALSLDLPYGERSIPEKVLAAFQKARPAAVLALFAEDPDRFLFILRAASLESHAGQIAFPGGMIDPGDQDSLDAALRETEEELGLARSCIEPFGSLPELLTVTGFRVTPWVGKLAIDPERLVLTPNAAEIAEFFWVELSQLQAPGVFQMEAVSRGPVKLKTPAFTFGNRRIWGATGAMVRNLLDRLEHVKSR